MSFSWKQRQESLASLSVYSPEVLIIGGGVVGSDSIAAHAAQYGLDCALIESADFATGASGNSTGLAHAGLRYLAQGRIAYVFRESRERLRLEALAPHWVRPFNFIFPVYKGDPFNFLLVCFGTALYDLFYRIASWGLPCKPGRHYRMLSRQLILEKMKDLRPEGLKGATQYFVDARLLDSRFTLGFAQCASSHGARLVTYARIESFIQENGKVVGVRFRDQQTQELFEVRARLIINATGPWIDVVRECAGLKTPVLQLSKGIHLLVDQIAETPLILSSRIPGKVFFIIPVGRSLSLIGTTDTPYNGRPGEERAFPEDIQELVSELFRFFPKFIAPGESVEKAIQRYRKEHVRRAYWGLRPLVRQRKSTLLASREHALIKEKNGLWSVPGVKLTAARLVGEQVAKEAWSFLRTEHIPFVSLISLPGGEFADFSRYLHDWHFLPETQKWPGDVLAYLLTLYGTRANDVLAYAAQDKRLHERVHPEEPWILAEAKYAAEHEMVVTLNDFLWRRTRWARLRDLSDGALLKIVQILGEVLNWSDNEKQKQITAFHEEWRLHQVG